ncbi:prion-like-(Q/N-rich) domain-bearing protein 25 [Chrysoperla carnea]|uniref:prion-like-(Q/N-rich) domain-bearing protein 25 n=1 Tax=Chrysoperla carnea TaxID=189513 RepID=UPI001D09989B|nr:prion-like-(Q/N-rich) domain-bearing protein 25 [Chrysoperla carnea]
MDCLYTPKYMGESCEKDVQCQVSFGNNAICSESHCKCSPNTHFENGVCYKNGKIGDQCDTNADCYIEDALTFCVNSVCVCNTYYHPIDGGTKCVKSKRLQDKCDSDSECTIENTRCLGSCRCQIHFVENKQRTACLKVVDNFDDFCEEDAQCSQFLDNGACVNNKCGCANGYHLYSNKCWKNVDIFEMCESENECIINSRLDGIVECVEERCFCKYGIHPNRTCFNKNYLNDKDGSNSGQIVFISRFITVMLCKLYTE